MDKDKVWSAINGANSNAGGRRCDFIKRAIRILAWDYIREQVVMGKSDIDAKAVLSDIIIDLKPGK